MSQTHIIIVNYNAGQWLTKAVQSALSHSQGLVSVVDNASSDDSLDTLQTFEDSERLKVIKNPSNRGFAAANNQVLSQISAEYAVLMNPDCELNSQTLPGVLEAMQQHPDWGIASCRILNQDGSIQATCRRRFPTPWSALVRITMLHRLFPKQTWARNFDDGDQVSANEKPQVVEAISGAFMVVRRSAMQEVSLLDEAYFMHCEDLDWCKRFSLSGWQVGFVPSVSVLHAKGVSSRSRPVGVLWNLHRGMNRFFDKYYRQQTPIIVRALVKVAIVISFALRAIKAGLLR